MAILDQQGVLKEGESSSKQENVRATSESTEIQPLPQAPRAFTIPEIVFTPSQLSVIVPTNGEKSKVVPAEVRKQPSLQDLTEKVDVDVHLEELDWHHDIRWLNQFKWIQILLIIFGRWPITYSEDPQKRGYVFKFSWTCVGFFVYAVTFLFTLFGLISMSINVVDILMADKVRDIRTPTQMIEQGLAERHTMVIIIALGSYGVNTLTLYFIFMKRHEISHTFTKWTRFLHSSKLNGGSPKVNLYVGVAAGNYLVFLIVYVVLTCYKISATFIGGPTVIAILFARQFLPANYLENFVGSSRHRMLHVTGLMLYFYVITSCNVYMYLFIWLVKSIERSFFSWNLRMVGVIESSASATEGDDEADRRLSQNTQNLRLLRLTYHALYHDHIGLVRMLSWFNNIFAYILEPYVLFMIVKIVYQMYLAALVMKSNGKPLNAVNVGKYFIRKGDYIAPLLLTYENVVMLLTIFLASAWLEDTAYESYDILRKYSLLKSTPSDKESFFFLSMFQSYTSTTKMAVCGAQYFCIDRYTILHALSAIMSNFLVVYQFAPLFDTDTTGNEELRKKLGIFLQVFEDLHPNHTSPVIESQRNNVDF